jgi:hypothetical protein
VSLFVFSCIHVRRSQEMSEGYVFFVKTFPEASLRFGLVRRTPSRSQANKGRRFNQPCMPCQTPDVSNAFTYMPRKFIVSNVVPAMRRVQISSPKNSDRNPVFLFQISSHQAILLSCPAIPRPTALCVISGETAVGVASPEVQRSAQLDAVVETVHESF